MQLYRVCAESNGRTWTVQSDLTRDEAHDLCREHRQRFPEDRVWPERQPAKRRSEDHETDY
jgi:hypothetical protein